LHEQTIFKENSFLKIDDIRNAFSEYIGKPVSKLEKGTFAQVNVGYIYDEKQLCKHCQQLSKSGCCEKYNRKDRIKKSIVKNISFIDL
jgi:hypothetical protein